jgi:hypothetical protein
MIRKKRSNPPLTLGLTLATAFLAATGALAAPPAKAGRESRTWAWIRVEGNPDPTGPEWVAYQGKTAVSLHNGRIHAALHWEEVRANGEVFGPTWVIDGVITGNRVVATQTQPDTDEPVYQFTGEAQRASARKDDYSFISLTCGGFYMALVRK